MKNAFATALARLLAAGAAAAPDSLGRGAALGDLARRLRLRRRVAESNLARAFPERSAAEREAILRDHYRELGRVAWEYPRLARLLRTPQDDAFISCRGFEHLEAAQRAGRGAILLTGHYGNFELLGAWLGRLNPVDFVVKPLSNPGVERMISGWRRAAGVGSIPIAAGAKPVLAALRANRWVAMLADQDARENGVFVPFFGIPSSTPVGPAVFALRTGAPIVMGFDARHPDGRHELTVSPPLAAPSGTGRDAVRALTAAHAARLEEWVRRNPPLWFWLHRRWKTQPPADD